MRFLIAILLAASCGKNTPVPDAGSASIDAAEPDAVVSDSSTPDSSVPDAMAADAMPPDLWEAVREQIDQDTLDDLTIQVGTAAGIQFTYSKGDSTPATAYLIASASKWLSSAVFMSLVESGALSLNDHPQDHLPFWTTDTTDPRSRITLEQLLAFTSGLPRDVGCAMLTTAECAERIHTEALDNTIEPGTVFNYGGSHMQVAGAMAIAASGRANWAQLFREHVGDPLGMSPESGFRPNPMIAGGASVSLDDYAKFVQAIFARQLVADSLAEMESDHTSDGVTIDYSPLAASGYEWHYGLGQWRECYQADWNAACDQHVRISSPGAFGFYPSIDRSASISYWVIVAREDMSAMSGGVSVELGARLTPAIEAALGIE